MCGIARPQTRRSISLFPFKVQAAFGAVGRRTAFLPVQAAFSLPESTAMSFNPQRLQLDTAFAHIDKGNYEAAAPVLRRFAEQGDIDAQYRLAFMLEHGLGVKTDLEGAVHWYAKAAEQGDLAAQFNLLHAAGGV